MHTGKDLNTKIKKNQLKNDNNLYLSWYAVPFLVEGLGRSLPQWPSESLKGSHYSLTQASQTLWYFE